ncbi:MAG TPA: hypothetical protein VL992_00930, partial [Tepidisphaeraceae bacterium]|nr:hypothetical protein [Tepidisphaeraceae bacterium]
MGQRKCLSRRQASAIGAAALAVGAGRSYAQVYFERNANGQSYSYEAPNGAMITGNFPANDYWSQSVEMGTYTYSMNNQTQYFYYQIAPANWSTVGPPDSPIAAVDIQNLVSQDNITTQIGDLEIDAGGMIQLNGGQALDVQGTNVLDNGEILVNTTDSSTTTILSIFAGEVSGTGTFVLNAAGAGAQLNGVITQDAGHTILGLGEINAGLTNYGLVEATVSGQALYLQTGNMTNYGLMEANDGALDINGILLTQGTAGELLANTSDVNLLGSSEVSGGTLVSASGGLFQITNGTNTIDSLTNDAQINQFGGTTLNVTGNLVDNGEILVNSASSNEGTILDIAGGTISGTGAFVLNEQGGGAQLNGTLTQASAHTISGYGEINAALTNFGVVDADASGQILYLQTSPMTNDNLLEAGGGGKMNIGGITVTQGTAGVISAGPGGQINLTGGTTIVGGTLVTTAGTVFQCTGGTNTLTNVASDAQINQLFSTQLDITGNLLDNGEILVNSSSGSEGTILDVAGGTISGTGSFVLNDGGGDAQLNGSLTQAAGHTISGYGEINATLVNYGLVNENVSNQTLLIYSPSVTNNAIMESTAGTLRFDNGTQVNNAGGQIIGNGGNIFLTDGATISGGQLTAGTANVVQVAGNESTAGFAATLAGGLTITSATTVDIANGVNLEVTGSTLTNNGEIDVNYTAASSSTSLKFDSSTLLNGGGFILLAGSGGNAQLNTGSGDTLTLAATQTVEGLGEINASLVNLGTLNANEFNQTMYLQTNPMTNDATFEATDGGRLEVNGNTVTQGTAGLISAGTGSTVVLANGTVIGGTLVSGPTASFTVSGSSALNGLTINALIDIPSGGTLTLVGNLTDNGTFVVNPSNGNTTTELVVAGGTISGTGSFVLGAAGGSAQVDGTLTQTITHTIQGYGEINANLTNDGVVNADVGGAILYLETSPMTNNGTFESTGGGRLEINGNTVTQRAAGTIIAGSNSFVLIDSGAQITGGTLVSVGNASFSVSGNDTIGSLTSDALIDLPLGNQLNVTGNLTDNGEIVLNPTQGNNAAILDVINGTVSGTGSFVLNYSGGNAQLNGTLTQASTHTISGFGQINANLTNFGTVNADVGGAGLGVNGTTTNSGLFEASNGGILQVASGALTNLSGTTLTGGTYEVNAGSTINLPGPVTVNAANIILNGTGTNFSAIAGTNAAHQTNLSTNSGSFTLEGGAGFSYLQGTGSAALVNTGTVSIGAGSTLSDNGRYSQSAGLSLVNGTLSAAGGVSQTGGTLSGAGTLSGGTVAMSGGEIEPGAAPADGNIGTLSMSGLNIGGGDLRMDIGAASNDNIIVGGTTTYSGASSVTPVFDNDVPVAGTYNLITAGSVVVNAGDAPSLVSLLPADTRFTLALQETSTAVNLVVAGSTASTIWVGTPASGAWDLVASRNWWNSSINAAEQADDFFYNLDGVTFDDTATQFNVALNTNVVPLSVTVNNSANNYTIGGTGGIGGTATLTKS